MNASRASRWGIRRCVPTHWKLQGKELFQWRAFQSGVETNGARFFSSVSTEQTSNRAAFRALPVDRKVLSYIESIGVGIPKRKSRARRPKMRRTKKLETDADELEFFARQRAYNAAKDRRNVTKERQKQSKQNSSYVSSNWLPPPPFASSLDNNKSESEAESSEGQRVKRHPVSVLVSVDSLKDLIQKSQGLPEVALAGRSNVGKSTLLNALLYGNQPEKALVNTSHRVRRRVERTKLPRGVKAVTSDLPGETRQITFYELSSDVFRDGNKTKLAMLLVDLPGYGFAFASEEKAAEWRELMKNYLLHRGKSLKRVLLLIDARHGMKKADADFLQSLESALFSEAEGRRDLPPIQLVLTKCDLVSQTDLAKRVVLVRQQLLDCLRRQPGALPVMLVSAKPGVGFDNVHGGRALGGVLELQREIATLASQSKKQTS